MVSFRKIKVLHLSGAIEKIEEDRTHCREHNASFREAIAELI